MNTMGKKKKKKEIKMAVLKKPSIQQKIREGKLRYLYNLAVLGEITTVTFFHVLSGFLTWELFSYYRGCSTNQN